MREHDWHDCLEAGTARRASPDMQRAASLRETADERISLISGISEKNCNFVFEDYYTSLLEILQALVSREGHKVLNHLCLGYYLRDTLKREDLFAFFDDVRYKRNALTYYGSRMDFETAKQAIEKCRKLIQEVKRLL